MNYLTSLIRTSNKAGEEIFVLSARIDGVDRVSYILPRKQTLENVILNSLNKPRFIIATTRPSIEQGQGHRLFYWVGENGLLEYHLSSNLEKSLILRIKTNFYDVKGEILNEDQIYDRVRLLEKIEYDFESEKLVLLREYMGKNIDQKTHSARKKELENEKKQRILPIEVIAPRMKVIYVPSLKAINRKDTFWNDELELLLETHHQKEAYMPPIPFGDERFYEFIKRSDTLKKWIERSPIKEF